MLPKPIDCHIKRVAHRERAERETDLTGLKYLPNHGREVSYRPWARRARPGCRDEAAMGPRLRKETHLGADRDRTRFDLVAVLAP